MGFENVPLLSFKNVPLFRGDWVPAEGWVDGIWRAFGRIGRGGRDAGGADKECAVLGTRDRRVNPEDDGPQSMETLNR